jgi:hypothetical protein
MEALSWQDHHHRSETMLPRQYLCLLACWIFAVRTLVTDSRSPANFEGVR